MAKEIKDTNKKGVKEKTLSPKKQEKENIRIERKKVENRIDALVKDKKATKDKDSKKKISKEIKKLKIERKNIGKKDTFLGDVKKEMSMVRWPSGKEVFKYTMACLIFVAFFALFFYGIDALFALVKGLIK